MRVGLKLCAEERTASDLLSDATRAEAAGFDFAAISDHYHPWVEAQGESPFVWGVLGGVAAVTDEIEVGTAVTCPTMRMHPAIVAQAAATAAAMFEGRFFLGVGTGEWLNEHVTGARWPRPDDRRAMLHEAIEVIRKLWSGEVVDHAGPHFRVEGARLFSTPDSQPPIMVAAAGPEAARLAAEIGDGIIGTSPNGELVSEFRAGVGAAAPRTPRSESAGPLIRTRACEPPSNVSRMLRCLDRSPPSSRCPPTSRLRHPSSGPRSSRDLSSSDRTWSPTSSGHARMRRPGTTDCGSTRSGWIKTGSARSRKRSCSQSSSRSRQQAASAPARHHRYIAPGCQPPD
jgi:hypothetical protein